MRHLSKVKTRLTALGLFALAGIATVAPAGAEVIQIDTSPAWRATSATPGSGWNTSVDFDDSGWGNAVQTYDTPPHYWANPISKFAYFRHEFDLDGTVVSGLLSGGIDDDALIYINGVLVLNDQSGSANNYSVDISSALTGGRNLIAVQGRDNGSGPGFFRANMSIVTAASAVPEPATWATMLIGFGMVGGAMRVRQRAVAASA